MRPLRTIAHLVFFPGLMLLVAGCVVPDKMHQPIVAAPAPVPPPVSFYTRELQLPKKNASPEELLADSNHATVEFCNRGEFADDCPRSPSKGTERQLDYAVRFVTQARKAAGDEDLVVVAYIHGNENNASEASDNYPHFRQAINCLNLGDAGYKKQYGAKYFEGEMPKNKILSCKGIPVPSKTHYVGVYLGWRGAANSTMLNISERTARKISDGPHVEETLYKLRDAAKDPAQGHAARFVVIGHSFGGLILQQTAIHIYKDAYTSPGLGVLGSCPAKDGAPAALEDPKGLKPFTDMMVAINPAVNSIPTKRLIEFFQERIDSFCHSSVTAAALYRPLLVSLVSKNDPCSLWFKFGICTTARHVFGGELACQDFSSCAAQREWADHFDSDDVWQPDPGGGLVGRSMPVNLTFFQNLCFLRDGTAPGEEACKDDLNRATGTLPIQLVPALPTGTSDPENPANHLYVRYDCRGGNDPSKAWSCKTPNPNEHRDDLHIWNKTPYWIAAIDSDVIDGHNGFWSPDFVKLLIGIVRPFNTLTSNEVIPTPQTFGPLPAISESR